MSQRAACVVIPREGLVLAVSRRDDHTRFGLPGGKVEPGETFAAAAARELWEETGVVVSDADLEPVYAGRTSSGTTVHTFLARLDGRWIEPHDSDDGAVRWVTWETLENGPFGDYNRGVRAALSGV